IRPDAAVELEKIVAVMKQHSGLRIDVRSHTDSRANDAYNRALSERRAKATVAYIVNRGIAKERLSGKGYGESELVNKCSNGVVCTEEGHQANRRSEFIILEQ
ncbi:MAG TPA: OmpA family protein, partial [Mariniflexile sp.]